MQRGMDLFDRFALLNWQFFDDNNLFLHLARLIKYLLHFTIYPLGHQFDNT